MKLSKHFYTLLFLLSTIIILSSSCTIVKNKTIHTHSATTFILTRHAEKQSGSNPDLSEAGQLRANELSRVLKDVKLNGIYSTNYNRTIQTATPISAIKKPPIVKYKGRNLERLADSLITYGNKGKYLIVGHSNTTPDLLNILIGSNKYSHLQESEYDNLFIVTVYKKGKADVLRLKYGK